MAKHRWHGKRERIPREFRGRAAHRAVSYAKEKLVVGLALWVALRVATPRIRG